MTKKKTHEEFLKELPLKNQKYAQGLFEVVSTYVNSQTKIKCHCNVCHNDWETAPKNLSKGSGCHVCAGNKNLTHAEFLSGLSQRNEKYRDGIFSVESKYKSMQSSVFCRCSKCNYLWEASPKNLYGGKGCPSCANRIPVTQEIYVEKLKKQNPNIEVLGQYSAAKKKIEYRCKKCGHVWKTAPETIQSGHGCPRCKFKKLSLINRKSPNRFLAELSTANPTIIPLEDYKTEKEKILVMDMYCKHQWYATPNSLLAGNGCPTCNRRGTSYVEQLLYCSFLYRCGEKNTLNRYRGISGIELDVFIPNKKYAIEYGSWYWHKNRLEKDIEKEKACLKKDIKLVTIYDAVPPDAQLPKMDNLITYNFPLKGRHNILFSLINTLFSQCCLKLISEEEYKTISKMAMKRLSRVKTDVLFIEKMQKVNSSVKVLGSYIDTDTKIQVSCSVCGHVWSSLPNNLLKRGSGCPLCANKSRQIKNRKKILCIETGIIYSSGIEAAEKVGVTRGTISEAANYNKTAAGCHWKFVDEVKIGEEFKGEDFDLVCLDLSELFNEAIA